MKLARLIPQLVRSLGIFWLIGSAHAGIPLWSFTPDVSFPPTAKVSSTGAVSVKYTVRNNSYKAHNLVIKPETGLSQNGACQLGPKGSASSTCQLALTINGSVLPDSGLSGGPILCQSNSDGTPNFDQCLQPSKRDSLAITVIQGAPILSASTASLALSINNTMINSALTGRARHITITNNGDAPANGLSISYPGWPAGTVVDTSSPSTCINGGNLAVNSSCTITIVPGATATSGAGNAACTTGIAPIPGVVSVTASSANQTSTNVVVLGYGCIYQSGYLYSVDDTTINTGNIGGRVVSLTDQAVRFPNGVIWSSNNAGTYDGGIAIYGIAETSTTSVPVPSTGQVAGQLACNGRSNGACNSNNIIVYYSPPQTNPAISSSFYAAGRCGAYTAGIYDDWYLPAVCEMGPASNGSGCIAGTQNIVSNLPSLLGDPNTNPDSSCPWGANCLSGTYWSSTESSAVPQIVAWYQFFTSGGGSFQGSNAKGSRLGVRCSRALTL